MAFRARINLPNWEPPARAYLHEAGCEEVYGKYPNIINARNYLLQVLDENKKENISTYNFILASIWGEAPDKKIIDFCGLSGIDESKWCGNPDVSMWVVENGVYVPGGKTCEDSIIVFGEEGKFRRTVPGPEEFSKRYPHLGELEPETSMEFKHSPFHHILEMV